jgi:hypothetical protein
MAFAAGTTLEVRPTSGNDTNGGGYSTGGTDWSQQNAPQYSVTDGVTAGTTTITSATANFGVDVVGNLISVSGGTGSLAQVWRQIVSRTNNTTIVVDAATGLGASTGVTLKIGGALATVATALALMTVDSMYTYCKAEATETIGTGLTPPTVANSLQSRLEGYASTRGDGGKYTLQASAGITMLNMSVSSPAWHNFVIDGNNNANVVCLNNAHNYGQFRNVVFKNASSGTAKGVTSSAALLLYGCEVTNCIGTNGAVESGSNALIEIVDCWIHANPKTAVFVQNRLVLLNSVIANNTGASSHGVRNQNEFTLIRGCVIYNNVGDGLNLANTASSGTASVDIANNIIAKNGGVGINRSASQTAGVSPVQIHHNALWSNTGGNGTNWTLSGTNVSLSADPFTGGSGNTTDGASNDFSLNNTAGGGAACRSVGFPGTLNGLTGSTGFADIGTFRHQDPAGGAGLAFIPNLEGT